jgi:hypothetical protein
MWKYRLRGRTRVTAAVVASTSALALGTALFSSGPAGADPPFESSAQAAQPAIMAAGSNTIEDIMNAFAGEEPTPGIGVPPTLTPANQILWDPVTGGRLYSWDAEDPFATTTVGCIQSGIGSPQFDRPNGSGNGRIALSDSLTGTPWWQAGGCVAASPGTGISGRVDVSRSSGGPPTSFKLTENLGGPGGAAGTTYDPYFPDHTGTPMIGPLAANCRATGASNITLGFINATTGVPCLTFIPFAHDGVTYAYWAGSGVPPSAVAELSSSSTLATLYSDTNATPGLVTVNSAGAVVSGGAFTLIACLPQSGSGTVSFFAGALSGGSVANASAAATAQGCGGGTGATPPSGIEENSGDSFVTTVNDLTASAGPATDTAYIIPISVGSYVSQVNGAAQNRSATFLAIGAYKGTPTPTFTCATAPTTSTSTGSYADLAAPDFGTSTALSAASTNCEPYDITGGVLNTPPYTADVNYDAGQAATKVGTWGRSLYVVVPWTSLDDTPHSNAEINMFGTCEQSDKTTTPPTVIYGLSAAGGPGCPAGSLPPTNIHTADGLPVICEGTVNPTLPGGTAHPAGPQDLLSKFGFVTQHAIQVIQGAATSTPGCGQQVPLDAAQGPAAGGGLVTTGTIWAVPGNG